MTFEIGSIVEGTVSGIKNFGVFVRLENGKTGMCHISEVADHYIKDIKDVLTESQQIKVKIVTMDANGKIAVSIRQAQSPSEKQPVAFEQRDHSNKPHYGFRDKRDSEVKLSGDPFEDMLSSFMKTAEEKQRSVKKATNGGRKGNGYYTR